MPSRRFLWRAGKGRARGSRLLAGRDQRCARSLVSAAGGCVAAGGVLPDSGSDQSWLSRAGAVSDNAQPRQHSARRAVEPASGQREVKPAGGSDELEDRKSVVKGKSV